MTLTNYDMTLTNYDISSNGFLPDLCVKTPPPGFEFLQPVVDQFSTKGIEFRELVDQNTQTNLVSTHTINSLSGPDVKFLYSFYSMMIHKYTWCCGEENYITVLPENLGKLWVAVSVRLDIPPVLTHASVDLFNWSLINPHKPFDLDNIKSNFLMMGTRDEEWFYLIMVAIEGIGGKILPEMMKIDQIIKENDAHRISNLLNALIQCLQDMNKILRRMREKCDPGEFFNKLRIYLTGTKHEKFPQGMQIQNSDIILEYKGGSAAQSSLIPVIDIFLGISHPQKHAREFLDEMRSYMPGKHRQFLIDFEKKCTLVDYVNRCENTIIKDRYERCVSLLKTFRSIHISIVHDYVMAFITPTRKTADMDNALKIDGTPEIGGTSEIDENSILHQDKGTGGTNPIKFLGTTIKNTKSSAIIIAREFDSVQWLLISCVCACVSIYVYQWYT
jgi:indoleamine 2,3-dioxygenase